MNAETIISCLGQKLREARKLRGLTLERVSNQIQISKQMLSLIERGRAKPSLKRLIQLGDLYKISFDLLLREDSNEQVWDNFRHISDGCERGIGG